MAIHGLFGSLPQYHLEEELIESHHTLDAGSLPTLQPFTCETPTTMSRRSFSNPYELISIVNHCRCKAAEKAIRALIVIEMAPDSWLRQLAQDYAIPFVEASNSTDRADRITGLLGSEQSLLTHELSTRFDAGLFAALAGTITAGGALIVGVPDTASNHFHQRFQKIHALLSQQFSDVVLCAQYLPHTKKLKRELHPKLEKMPHQVSAQFQRAASKEQDQLHKTTCEFLTQHNRACVLITGRRGRGKSMLLARLATWLEHKQLDYRITAANQSGVSTIYQYCPESRHAFISPDKAIKGVTKRLLIDEAGSLPLSTLMGFVDNHEQIILSTTVDGYENIGRAFHIRYAPHARNNFAHVLELQPTEPWRWARHDPLEQLIDQLLLTEQATLTTDLALPAKSSTAPIPTRGNARRIEQAELVDDEAKLLSLFALLRETHYQTTTQDLEHLLDNPDIQIWIVEKTEKIVAAVLLTLEGPIADNLHEAVVSKKRRLHHHLLPQLLAQSANAPDALITRYARVIRISVVESMRRTGMASQLIRSIETSLFKTQNDVVAMGASFAADTTSVAFWLANGYTEFHRGFKQNPRTGKKAVAMIKAWDSNVISIINCAVQIHTDNCRVRDQIEASPTSQENGLLSARRQSASTTPLHYDLELLTRFVANQRSMNDTLGSLDRIARRHNFILQNTLPEDRARHEASMRETVSTLLVNWP